ncbi:MAG: Ni/Fe-hydrogenase cytochrome b subunit [Desulfuromonadia bacterium]
MAHHDDEFVRLEGKILTRSFFVLLALVVIGFYYIGVRYVKGIGAVSNMSDGYPWGIWIAYDVATGTAIACGGYAMAILIYIRNHWQFHPMIRSALLTSLFGYGLAGFSVIIDLGRYWNSYGFFIPSRWQINSAMFEVALCVMTYTLVLTIEFLPAVLWSLERTEGKTLKAFSAWLHPRLVPPEEKLLRGVEWTRSAAAWLRPRLDKVLIFFIVLGITLPTMHQSSLGSLMLIAATKLHPLWHTGFLPLLFLINCIYIGYAIVILESIISSISFNRPLETEELSGMAKLIPYLTIIWLVVRLGDLGWRGHLLSAVSLDFYSLFFLLEFGLIAGGSLILFNDRKRRSPRWLFISAILLVLGGGLYRFNVYLIGFNPGQGWHYFPAFPELMITVGVIALEILGYQVLVKLFPVLPNPAKHHSTGMTTAVWKRPSPAAE